MAETITQDLASLAKDLSNTISTIEFCRLTSGTASNQTIALVKRLIATKYSSLANFSSSEQILNLFSILGSTIDNRICREAIEAEEQKRPSQRRLSRNLCRSDIKSQDFLKDRVTPEEAIDLLSRVANDKTNAFNELARLTRPDVGNAELQKLADLVFASPSNLDGAVPRNPRSFNSMQRKIGSRLLLPVEKIFNSEVNDHIPTLFNKVQDPSEDEQGREIRPLRIIFADNFKHETKRQIDRELSSLIRFRADDLSPANFYRSFVNFRLGTVETNDYYRRRPRNSEFYDISENPGVTKVLPFITNTKNFSPFGFQDDRHQLVYGLIPHRRLPDDQQAVQWDEIRDAYSVQEIDSTEPIQEYTDPLTRGEQRREKIFTVGSQQRLPEEISNYLKNVGDGTPQDGVPGSVDAFYDIIENGWINGAHSPYITEDFANFFRSEANRNDHYSIFFPEATKNVLSYISGEINRSGMFAGDPNHDEILKQLTCNLKLVSDLQEAESETGILDLNPIIEKIVDLESNSEVSDRSTRSGEALCGALYRLYIKIVAIKIVLESMFIFSRFPAKMIFSSKLFMKYFVRYFLREVRDIDEQFLFRMLDHFRNEIEARQTPWSPATAPESETRESLQQGEEFIDPLTGQPTRVITSYYVSNEEQSAGASQGRSGDHGRPRRNRILNGPLRDRDILDLIDRDDEQSDEERDPCDADLAEIILGLIGDGQLDLDGRPIIGFLEYFVKEQMADLIPNLEKTFQNYNIYESESLFQLLTEELTDYMPELDVAVPRERTLLSDISYRQRFFQNLSAEDTFLSGRSIGDNNFELDVIEEINNYLDQNPNLSEEERSFYESLLDPMGFVQEYGDQYSEEERAEIGQRSLIGNDFGQRRRGERFVQEYLNTIVNVHSQESDFIKRGRQHFKNGGFIIEKYVRLPQGYRNPVQSLEEFGVALHQGRLDRILGPADISLEDTDERGVKQITQSSPVKVGYRLCYMYPLQLNKEINFTNDVLTQREDRAVEGQVDVFEAWKDLLFEQDLDQLKVFSKRERAFLLREDVGLQNFVGLDDVITVGNNNINVPGPEVERFGRDDVASLLPELRQLHYVTVPIAVEEEDIDFGTIRFVDVRNGGDRALLEREGYYRIDGAQPFVEIFEDRHRPALRRRLLSGPALKTIFEYCFPLDRFLSFLTIYNAEHIRTMSGREDFLKETQKMIVRTCQVGDNLKNPDWWAAGVDDEEVFGSNAIKEEQLDVAKNTMPIFATLKIITGLIDLIPALKPWFKGLFNAIPKALNRILDFPENVPGVPSIGSFLNLPGSLVNLFREAGSSPSPPLPKMPPYKTGAKDPLEGATEDNIGCEEAE